MFANERSHLSTKVLAILVITVLTNKKIFKIFAFLFILICFLI